MLKYRLYPTLLNTFARYQTGLVSENELLDRINRVPVPKTEAQARGISFEEAVVKGTNEELFDEDIIRRVRSLLPRPLVATQVYCEHQINDVLLYGFLDVLGTSLAVDIKTTGSYTFPKFEYDHQHFYLLALRKRGIRSLRYVITDFREVYHENYDLTLDFSKQEQQIADFCCFLESRRPHITDRRIFYAPGAGI